MAEPVSTKASFPYKGIFDIHASKANVPPAAQIAVSGAVLINSHLTVFVISIVETRRLNLKPLTYTRWYKMNADV